MTNISCTYKKECLDQISISFYLEKGVLNEEQQELGHLVMEALSVLLTANSANAGVFHQCGGARCAHNMVPYPECRQQALNIVQQLVLSPGGDDDMGTLLGLMPTASVTDLELKTHILRVRNNYLLMCVHLKSRSCTQLYSKSFSCNLMNRL